MMVKPDIRFSEGDKDRPLAVFIHGLGMNADFWAEPRRARVLGGSYPLSALLGGDVEMMTSYQDLEARGFGVLTWSQSRPAGPIAAAVRELGWVLTEYKKRAGEGLLFICHSRGGLVARKYLEARPDAARAVITLSTPHEGTSLAKWAAFMSPLAAAVTHLLKDFDRQDTDTAFRKIVRFIGSAGLKELLAGSDFYKGLKDEKAEGVKYVSIGGTDPNLFRALALPLPQLLASLVPAKLFPEEMRDGRGDGLVSAASSVLPYGDEHRNFPLNHASIIFDRGVRDLIIESV